MRRIALTLTALAAVLAVSACSDPAQQSGGTAGAGSIAPMTQPRAPVGGAMTDAQRLAQMQQELQSNVGDRVYFGTDSVQLTGEARTTLDRQVAFLGRYPAVMLRIEGHADERGTREYNLALGDKRAQAVKEYLMARGVNGGRLTTSTYGKERPESVGSSESAWSQNRRSVSVIAQ